MKKLILIAFVLAAAYLVAAESGLVTAQRTGVVDTVSMMGSSGDQFRSVITNATSSTTSSAVALTVGTGTDNGFDGVHALEPTAGVELARAKEIAAGRICLLGNIDVTHILVDASRDEVFEAVRQAIEDAGTGGGYIVAPTNSHPQMSVQRLRWMIEATRQYGAC